MSMFNYERVLHHDSYTFKDKAGDIGEIAVWDDGDVGIYVNDAGLLLSQEQAKELAAKLMELTRSSKSTLTSRP